MQPMMKAPHSKQVQKYAEGGLTRPLPPTPLRDLESSDIDFQQAKLLKKAIREQKGKK